MSDTEKRNFTFEEISVWDWYDGIVRATGVFLRQHYFITLAAWDIPKRRKAYVLSHLPTGLAEELKSLENEPQDSASKHEIWDSFTQLFESYIKDYTGLLYLSFDEPQIGYEFASRIIDPKHFQTLRNYDVEKSVSEAACTYWFSSIISSKSR